jgi:hypothetical protein
MHAAYLLSIILAGWTISCSEEVNLRGQRINSDTSSSDFSTVGDIVEVQMSIAGDDQQGLNLAYNSPVTDFVAAIWCEGKIKTTAQRSLNQTLSFAKNSRNCVVFFDRIFANGKQYIRTGADTYDAVRSYYPNGTVGVTPISTMEYRSTDSATVNPEFPAFASVITQVPLGGPYSINTVQVSINVRFFRQTQMANSGTADFFQGVNMQLNVEGSNYPKFGTTAAKFVKSTFSVDANHITGICPMQVTWLCDLDPVATSGALSTCDGLNVNSIVIDGFLKANTQSTQTVTNALTEVDPLKIMARKTATELIVRLPIPCTQSGSSENYAIGTRLSYTVTVGNSVSSSSAHAWFQGTFKYD